MSPSGSLHGIVSMRLGALLAVYIDQHHLGHSFGAETGFVLSRDPDTVRAPDFAFVRTERIPESGPTERFFAGAPDFAAEILSPSDPALEVEQKVQEYLAAGTQLVWVVNPRLKTVTVYDQSSTARLYRAADTLAGGPVLPGLELPIARLFD
jgi:Uma2 family endonuclease